MEDEKVEQLEVSVSQELTLDKAKAQAKSVLKLLSKAKNKVGDRFSQHQENMAFYEGTQYELSRYKTTRPWVVRMRTPYASVAIDTRVSSLTASDYRGKLFPYNPDDQDAVQAIDDFKNDEWERMNIDVKIDEAIKTSAIVRESYMHIIMSGKGKKRKMTANIIDLPSSVYIDPNALSLREARWMCVASRIEEDEAKERYPDFAFAFEEMGTRFTPEDRGEVYFTNDYSVEQEDTLTMVVMYKKKDGKITKYVVIEDILVDEQKLDGLTQFPIAQMRWKKAAGSPYGLALMDDLKEPQKAINAIESASVNTAVAYSAPSYGVRKGSGVDPKQLSVALGAPGMIVMVDGDPAQSIKPLNLPALDQSIIGVRDSYILAIDRVSGITGQYLGAVGTTGNTAQGAKMAMERARIVEGDVLRNIEDFVEDITRIIIEYIIAEYQGETISSRTIDKATNQPQFNERTIPQGIDDIDFSFYINLEKRTSYSSEREKELLLELYQMQHQYKDKTPLINQLDLLGAYELSNRDVLIDRYKKMTQRSNEEVAKFIAELTIAANQVGISPEAVQAAIQEQLGESEETPITDQLLQQIQQLAQQQAATRQQQMQQFQSEMQQAGVPATAMQAAQQQMQGGGQGQMQ